jgi:hypothetical protein
MSKRKRTAKSFGDDYIYTLWMTLQESLKRHIPLLMLTFGRKQYRVRWVQKCLMKLGKLLNVLLGVNL